MKEAFLGRKDLGGQGPGGLPLIIREEKGGLKLNFNSLVTRN